MKQRNEKIISCMRLLIGKMIFVFCFFTIIVGLSGCSNKVDASDKPSNNPSTSSASTFGDQPQASYPDLTTEPSLEPTFVGPVINSQRNNTAFQLGQWLFYRFEGAIYKMKPDLTEMTKLADSAHLFCVDEEWLYFTNFSEDDKLYRVRTDGSGLEKLNDDPTSAPILAGEWIYYINWGSGDDRYICRIKTDGTERQKLCDDTVHESFILLDSWLYYCNESDNSMPYRIMIDGSKKEPLGYDLSVGSDYYGEDFFYIDESWIYWPDFTENKTYRMNLDGSNKQVLLDYSIGTFKVVEGYLYYPCKTDSERLYKMDLTTGEQQKLNDDVKSSWMEIAGDWVYYIVWNKDQMACRVKLDGTMRQEMHIKQD